jgi:hypothetical protein
MEYGIKINGLGEEISGKYKYVYFGDETCERKMPAPEDAKKIFLQCAEKKITPVLMLPFMTDAGIEKAEKLVNELDKLNINFEATTNDLGIIETLIKTKNCTINCGRLLIKMKKGPEIMAGEKTEAFRANSLKSTEFIKFMEKLGIKRFETDIPPQGIDLPEGKNITAYLGNVLISTTRRCPFIDIFSDNYTYKVKECHKECLKMLFTKKTQFHKETIYAIGNSEYLTKEKNLEMEMKGKVNRVVVFKSLFKHACQEELATSLPNRLI